MSKRGKRFISFKCWHIEIEKAYNAVINIVDDSNFEHLHLITSYYKTSQGAITAAEKLAAKLGIKLPIPEMHEARALDTNNHNQWRKHFGKEFSVKKDDFCWMEVGKKGQEAYVSYWLAYNQQGDDLNFNGRTCKTKRQALRIARDTAKKIKIDLPEPSNND